MSGFHLIDPETVAIGVGSPDDTCAACEHFAATGEKTFPITGDTSTPLCLKHFNTAIDKVL